MSRPIYFSITLLFVVTFFFESCNDDPEPQTSSAFNNGVFVVNEGAFSDSDGSLSYFDLDSQKVFLNLFEEINGRPFAGLFQSLTFYNQKGYMIDQSGRIEIIDAGNLTSLGTMDAGFDIPRYFAGFGAVGFVSDWGPYDDNFMSPESSLKVIDLDNYVILTEIESPSRPEGILIVKDKLYVANSASNLVSIYDPASRTLIKELETGYGPTQFVIDKKGNLWVICTGAFITTASLAGINTDVDEVFYMADLSSYTPNGRITINGAGDVLYFLSERFAPDFSYTETVIYRIELSLDGIEPGIAQLPEELIAGTNWYGMGMDPGNDILYVSDAVAFQANGTIYRYTLDGVKIDEFPAGRGPREFIFRIN